MRWKREIYHTVSVLPFPSCRQGEHGGTLPTIASYRPDPKLHGVLGQIHSDTPDIANIQAARPLQRATRAPDQLVARHQGVMACRPRELAVVAHVLPRRVLASRREPDGLRDGNVLRRSRRVGGAPHARQVDPRHALRVPGVDVPGQVPVLRPVRRHPHVLVLVSEVLDRLGEAHRAGEPRRQERLVVAAAEEAVGSVEQRDLHVGGLYRPRRHLADEAAQVPRRRVVLVANLADLGLVVGRRGVGVQEARAKEPDGVVVDGRKRRELARPDDVVVEVALDVGALRLERLRQVLRAIEALLLARRGDEEYRGGRGRELRTDPSQFQDDRHAAGVVVGAGGIARVVHDIQVATIVVCRDDVDPVGVRRPVDPRHDVGQVDREGDAARNRLCVGVQVDVHGAA